MKQRRRRSLALSAVAALAMTLLSEPVRASETVSWTLPAPDGRDLTFGTTSAQRVAVHEFAAEELGAEVNMVTAKEASGGSVDVRGQRADGTWSEWIPVPVDAPAVLPESTRTVQTRLVVSAPDELAAVDMTAWEEPRPEARLSAPTTYRVFATREGLVGGTTANGHVITERDHFVALPSRKGLAGKGSGNYTVKVCTSDGARCEWAPVWDVGPWNTKDDYWNSDREQWRSLPQGKPQAQAAYQDGFNDGKDQFGRKVLNPAGIDLADGTFWDGLQLPTNAWVDVTYQWTSGGPWGTVETSGFAVNVRSGPALSGGKTGYAARYAQVRIECAVTGQRVSGSQGTTDRWYRLAPGMYVSAAFVKPGVSPGSC
ncbi:hypothetical protein BAY61_02100 [Prauserella marina]|uniref:Uncharacterized protein n=1 Tax=Prauserella marina TaxID=530584 RepID=A0A222VJN6_9PSEU|nr:hypothetical protein [Prauserella marina]ASR33983.1 hypothetical protein BAY61_02100 [Prauserella marina]PWV82596.1 hypothetical protein DES30_102839 [Prauserella marina]SDC72749.1 hypothetical protein SAMN05421630_103375 [Prauserella marina]